MSSSALVTGASGFVGRHLVETLRAARWRVVTLDRHPEADRVGDLGQVPLRDLSVDVVFHLAAFANPSASIDAARETFDTNARATARLIREVRADRFVLASSCQVYGPSDRAHVESDRARPRNPYAASKLCGEALALSSGKDVVVLRPFNHTGPGQSDAYVCPRIARQVARAESGLQARQVLVESQAPRLDFFDVRDMARAYLLAAERARSREIYNVATGRPVSIGRIAEILLSLALVPLGLHGKKGAATVLTGDSSKFRRDTGWGPEIPLGRTLADLLRYERLALSEARRASSRPLDAGARGRAPSRATV